MTIYVWTSFAKKINSTAQPTGGTSKTVTLKEGTSVENPTFILSGDHFDICYVKAFSDHYYFVTDVKSVHKGLTEISCKMDVMATYKTSIGNYTAFIERSEFQYNPMLADPNVSIFNSETITEEVEVAPFNSTGYFCISVLNNIGSGNGFCTYYLTNSTELENLAAYINTDWGSAATDIVDWFQATFLHTADSIIDCIWVPISVSAIPSGAVDSWANMKIGIDVVSTASGYRVKGPCIATGNVTIDIPHVYTDFRKAPPYTQGKLYIPGYGVVDFNPLDFDGDKIKLTFDMDVTTGDTICYMQQTTGKVIATYTYNMGVQCPVGKVGADVTRTAGGVLTTGGAIAGALLATTPAGAVAGGVAAAASGINTLANVAAPTISVHGGKAGRAITENGLNVKLTLLTKVTSDPDDLLPICGRPLMVKGAINTQSGFVKCSDASISISGMEEERTEINNFLNNGFFYE